MSLINDALKRAKQTHQQNPPATPPLEFRPAEPSQNETRRTTLIVAGLSLVLICIFGLSAALIWYVSQSQPAAMPVAARVADPPLAPLPKTSPAITANPTFADDTNGYIERPDEPNTNGVPVVAAMVEAIKPAALKLQGIFFNPNNPSAVVSGTTVYLGDRVRGFRVTGISPVAVTLVSATETNVLSLSAQ